MKLYLLLMATGLIWVACRKMDKSSEGKSQDILTTSKFFSNHRSNDPTVNAAMVYIQKENQKYNFVSKVAERVGYPHWNGAVVFEDVETPNSLGDDSAVVVYIPFVAENEQHVNTTLMLKMTETDTAFQYLCDWQYSSLGFDTTSTSWNAKDALNIFMRMDNSVFGDTQFIVTDGRILGDSQQTMKKLTFKAPPVSGAMGAQNQNNLFASLTFCNIVTACVYVGEPMFAGRTESSSLPSGSCVTNFFCTTIYYDTGLGTGGTGGGGGGGTGGGTGGGPTGGGGGTGTGGTGTGGGIFWIPPPRPPVGTAQGGGGWVTVVEDPPFVSEDPADTLLRKYSRAMRDTAIYIYDNLSQPTNIEYAFTGIWYDNQIKIFERTEVVHFTRTQNSLVLNNNDTCFHKLLGFDS